MTSETIIVEEASGEEEITDVLDGASELYSSEENRTSCRSEGDNPKYFFENQVSNSCVGVRVIEKLPERKSVKLDIQDLNFLDGYEEASEVDFRKVKSAISTAYEQYGS